MFDFASLVMIVFEQETRSKSVASFSKTSPKDTLSLKSLITTCKE